MSGFLSLFFVSFKAEASMPEKEVQKETDEGRRKWQKRIIGKDVFGLGLGKPSMLDHLMVTDTRRYGEVKLGSLSGNTIK